jgi:hypothetical protein
MKISKSKENDWEETHNLCKELNVPLPEPYLFGSVGYFTTLAL